MSEIQDQKYYIGDKKVRGVRDIEEKTPAGRPLVEVEYNDKSTEVMPRMRYEAIISHRSADDSTTNDNFTKAVASNLYGLLHEYGIKVKEVEFIVQHLVGLVNSGSDRATDVLWNEIAYGDRTLLMINNVLLKNNNKNGTPPTGSGPNKEN